MMERTVVLIKPDGMQKHIVGEIISRFEKAGLRLVALKMVKLTQPILDVWYAHHKDKPFFPVPEPANDVNSCGCLCIRRRWCDTEGL